jgi:hypothetical protein
VALENYIHLVHLEPGRIEFRPHARAPRTLAGDLQQKLRDWTGERWAVSIASTGGAPTLAEQKQSAKTARFEAVAQDPLVRAVLDRFPGAEIVAARPMSPRRCRKAILNPDGGAWIRDRAPDPVARQIAGAGAAFGPPRGAGAAEKARHHAGTAGRVLARSRRCDPDLRNLRQS